MLRFAGLVTVAAVACFFLSRIEILPYNVRELFEGQRLVASLGIAIAGGLVCVTPWILAAAWSHSAPGWRWASIWITFVLASVVFWCLRFVLPDEPIDDIVGYPKLDIGPNVERWVRFAGLFLGLIWSQGLGVLIGNQGVARSRSNWPTLLGIVLGIALSYLIVVVFAVTDNITELLDAEGRSLRVAALPAWMILVGAVAAFLVIPDATKEMRGLAVLALVASCPVGWMLASLALEDSLTKYGETFSGMQFLLSTDRDNYLPVAKLIPRFAVVHYLVVVALLAGGGVCSGLSKSRDPSTRPLANGSD